MEKDAFYFPHFSNARNDKKLKRARKELGIEGYGIFFMLLEVLREESDFKYPLKDIDLLADDFNTSEQKVRTIIANYELFEVDEEQRFFSSKFIEFLQPYITMKEQRRLAGIASGLARKNKHIEIKELEQPMNGCSTDVQRMLNENEQSKVNKVKETKKTNETNKNVLVPSHLLEIWPDYLSMRIKIKKPATERAQKNIISDLEKLAPDDFQKQIKIVEQSITNSWQGVFGLKSEQVEHKQKYGRQDRPISEIMEEINKVVLS